MNLKPFVELQMPPSAGYLYDCSGSDNFCEINLFYLKIDLNECFFANLSHEDIQHDLILFSTKHKHTHL